MEIPETEPEKREQGIENSETEPEKENRALGFFENPGPVPRPET